MKHFASFLMLCTVALAQPPTWLTEEKESLIKAKLIVEDLPRQLDKEMASLTGGTFISGMYDTSRAEMQLTVGAFSIQKYEVSNSQYRTYIYALYTAGKDWQAAYPDTAAWDKEYVNADPLKKYYFHHPGFNEYPVVGLSLQQIQGYISWLNTQGDHTYRLPSEWEWEYAAKGGLKSSPYPWLAGKVGALQCLAQKKKGQYTFHANFRPQVGDYIMDGYEFMCARGAAFQPNDYGLYHMSGNVAEVCEGLKGKPLIKGGSWADAAEGLVIDRAVPYTANYNTSRLGFRLVRD